MYGSWCLWGNSGDCVPEVEAGRVIDGDYVRGRCSGGPGGVRMG